MTHFEEYKKQGVPGTFNLPEIPGSSKRDYPENRKNHPENYPENFRGFKGQSAGDAQRTGRFARPDAGRNQIEHRKTEKRGQTAPHWPRQRREMGSD